MRLSDVPLTTTGVTTTTTYISTTTPQSATATTATPAPQATTPSQTPTIAATTTKPQITSPPGPTTPQQTTYGISTTTSIQSTTAVARNCSEQNLSNTVVYEGTPVSFPRVNNGQPAQWRVAPSDVVFNPIQNITNYNDTVVTQYATTYAVDSSQLKVFKATTAPEGTMPHATAGMYILEYRDPRCITAANLIVISEYKITNRNYKMLNLLHIL